MRSMTWWASREPVVAERTTDAGTENREADRESVSEEHFDGDDDNDDEDDNYNDSDSGNNIDCVRTTLTEVDQGGFATSSGVVNLGTGDAPPQSCLESHLVKTNSTWKISRRWISSISASRSLMAKYYMTLTTSKSSRPWTT